MFEVAIGHPLRDCGRTPGFLISVFIIIIIIGHLIIKT